MKKNSLIKRTLAILLAVMTIMSLAACSGGGAGDEDSYKITYWIAVGEDTSYYPDYDDNPVVQYLRDNYTFNGKKLEIDFCVAPPGSESDDWSTLINTGSYCGVMSMTKATATVAELYDDGIIWDLTELVPQHMPNLMAFLKANPELEDYLYTYVDGEKKILSLTGFSDTQESNFEGYVYRRDWIAKYGKNPSTGAAFTYGFADPADNESWYDDVVFPSGGTDPIYISDWEWMFEIFETAMAAEGITGGYCFSPYYLGYMATGDLYSGFGGGAPTWYYDGERIVYGLTNDNMRAYLQCLNTWYKNAWLNSTFDECTGDMFYAVDTANVFQGKVGLWQGRVSTVGTQIAEEGTATEGCMVYGCSQPINDIYGGAQQQNVQPNVYYLPPRNGQSAVLTDKLSEAEVIAFLEYIDYLYTEEGAILANCGLNKEQYEAYKPEYYTNNGMTDGAFYEEEVNGEIVRYAYIDPNSTQNIAARLGRVMIKLTLAHALESGADVYLEHATEQWDCYPTVDALPHSVEASISLEQNQRITKIEASLNQFLSRTVPAMIKGDGYDIWDDTSWTTFCNDAVKYRANEVTAIYQGVLENIDN